MTRTGLPTPGHERLTSANERFKKRWERYVGRATLCAAALHALAFGFVPGWDVTRSASERGPWEGTTLVALPPIDGLTNETGAPAAPLPVLAEEDETEARDGTEDGAVVTEAPEAVDLWDAIGERLRRRGALVPSLAEPEEVERESEAVAEGADGDTDGESPSIGGQALTAEMSDLPAPGALDLDRLSAVRPELAVQLPSAWVLIRNPVEVETFLRRGYLQGTLDPSATGQVSVTLWIDQRGAVQWAEISESSGRQDLDEYALALFNEVAAFKAAREDGVSVSRSVTLSVSFPW